MIEYGKRYSIRQNQFFMKLILAMDVVYFFFLITNDNSKKKI